MTYALIAAAAAALYRTWRWLRGEIPHHIVRVDASTPPEIARVVAAMDADFLAVRAAKKSKPARKR